MSPVKARLITILISHHMDGTLAKHGLFGKVKIINKYSEGALEYEYSTKDGDQVTRWEQLHKLYSNMPKTNMLVPIEIAKKRSGDQTSFRLVFGDYYHVLDHQRANRQTLADKFTEMELWYLLYNMVEASKNAHDAGFHLCVPCGDTILLNQFGNIQIFTELTMPNWKEVLKTRSLTLSPQELQAKSNPTLNVGLNRAKSQSFNIGVTILELGTLLKSTKVYEGQRIDQEQLLKLISKFRIDYSPFLTKIIGSMLKTQVDDRSSSGEVWAALSPYRSQINSIESFDPKRELSLETLQAYLKTNYRDV